MLTALISVIIVLVVVGAAVALLNMLPIDATIKRVIYILIITIVIVAALLWLLQGLTGHTLLR